MCGIAGIINPDPQNVRRERLRAATECLQHRGPESEGIHLAQSGRAALGHRRLSIIDLSESAAQPMHQGALTIVHNGELYNYQELGKELTKLGYSFRTHSDTEVILAAYAAWGKECLCRFDGMFAFAIWNETSQELFAARDRFGEKPLFFSFENKELLFASQAKAIFSMGFPREVNHAMLYNFLTHGYASNPHDPQESFYTGISKLPAASSLKYSLVTGELLIEKYWQPVMDEKTGWEDEDVVSHFRDMFFSSVGRRLRSDVAVGTSLSGGLDSSAIVAACAREKSASYSHKCFTASFEGFEKDETVYAAAVARKFGLEHHSVRVSTEQLPQLMEEVMRYQEEPFGSSSVLAQYRVYQLAKEHGVTVLLDGQGADELLGGYHKYFRWYWQELYRSHQLGRSGELAAAQKNGVREAFGWKYKLAALMPDFAAAMHETGKARKAFHHKDLDRAFAFTGKRHSYYAMPATPTLNAVLYFDSFVHGLEELLRLADRNSMAHAVEVRLPFLDHMLAEFIFSLPATYKIRNGWSKWLLRKSMETELPENIIWRKDKTGFEPPQKKWMQYESVQKSIMEGKKLLVEHHILQPSVLKKIQPHDAYAAGSFEWRYWSASFLFR